MVRIAASKWVVGLVLVGVAAGCNKDEGGDTGAASSSGTTAADGSSSSSATASASMSSTTTGNPECDAPTDCATCWTCARYGECKPTYDVCANSIDCTGSLACVDSKCAVDGLPQDCFDLCCMNCNEHFSCSGVDAAVACIQAACSDVCMTNTACGG